MIPVDYDLIDQWLKAKHITRRKLCATIGIAESTFANAIKRKSKMQVAYVWRIADFMDISPADLLPKDQDGNVDPDDLDRVSFGRTDYEVEIENETINEIVNLLRCFNPGGLEEVGKMVGLLWEIPRFRKDVNEFYDGSPDFWKRHPYEKQVKPYKIDEGESNG